MTRQWNSRENFTSTSISRPHVNVLIVDTSSWISFFHGAHHPELELALKEARVILSPIVAAELASGAQSGVEEKQLKALMTELKLFEASLDHWLRVGTLRQKLAQKGLSISTPDAHIAQASLDLEGYLMTEDLVFTKISKLVPLKLL